MSSWLARREVEGFGFGALGFRVTRVPVEGLGLGLGLALIPKQQQGTRVFASSLSFASASSQG